MKKIFHRPRGHSKAESPEADDALQASPYERTTPRTPPRVGTTPIKGKHEPLPLAEPVVSPQEDRPEPQPAPTNFSRLPPARADAVRNMTHDRPPSPTAIRPQDLASPEYSYLSNVYGPKRRDPMPRRDIPDVLVPGHPEPIHRKEIGSGPSSTRTSMDPDRMHREQDEAAKKLQQVVNLTDTVDTEVITQQAPAVVHEVVVPQVHHVREERIEREIHTHDVIHRIQPVIDVQVLPPRHFVPTEAGGLREVSVDEIPARRGHWGIVETVTKPPGGPTESTESDRAPEVVQLPPTQVDGVTRTEVIVRHPPTLETGARDTGQSWPMRIDPEHYERIHGLPAGQHPPHVPEPRRLEDAAPTLHERVANEPVAPPVVEHDVVDPIKPIAPSIVDHQTAPRVPAGAKNKIVMPGAFPGSSASTATLRTVHRPS